MVVWVELTLAGRPPPSVFAPIGVHAEQLSVRMGKSQKERYIMVGKALRILPEPGLYTLHVDPKP